MGLTELKKELKKLNKDKIIDLMADLYKKNKSVKEYFDFYTTPDETELFNKYREKVYQAFYPKRGFGYKLKDAKRAISDFKKPGTSTESIADLMLFYVETGVQFTIDFGDIDENFYSSLEKTYEQSLILMSKGNLPDKFADRTSYVVANTSKMGWGFGDTLACIYNNFYDPI